MVERLRGCLNPLILFNCYAGRGEDVELELLGYVFDSFGRFDADSAVVQFWRIRNDCTEAREYGYDSTGEAVYAWQAGFTQPVACEVFAPGCQEGHDVGGDGAVEGIFARVWVAAVGGDGGTCGGKLAGR